MSPVADTRRLDSIDASIAVKPAGRAKARILAFHDPRSSKHSENAAKSLSVGRRNSFLTPTVVVENLLELSMPIPTEQRKTAVHRQFGRSM